MYPKIIYLCNKNIGKNERKMAKKWKILNPEYEIKLFDDTMIKQFFKDNYNQLYLDIFNFINDGPIKSDFWRICILFKLGGVYSDIDNEPLVSISSFIEKNIDLCTCESKWIYKFNPNFIVSKKNNTILEKGIKWYINKYIHYKNNYSYSEWSIMKCFTEVIDFENLKKKNMKIQILNFNPGKNHYDSHVTYKDRRILNNRIIQWDCINHSFIDI